MIHLDVIVADVDLLLATQGYGAGALIRWESSATVGGTYAEGGTVALVSGTSVYDIWDAAGTVGTWYRTRISDSTGSTFSGYTLPYQTTEQGLYLTLNQLRGFNVGAEFSDESLLILLGSAAMDIVEAAGPMGPIVERLRGGRGPLLLLTRSALSVASVVEDGVTLTETDYDLGYGAYLLTRLNGSGSQSWTWGRNIVVTYQPQDDLAQRQRVQLALVKLDATHAPGLASQRIGEWAEQYSYNSVYDYNIERSTIISSLTGGGAVLIR